MNGRVLLTNDAVALEVLSEPLGAPRWKQLYAGGVEGWPETGHRQWLSSIALIPSIDLRDDNRLCASSAFD